MPPNYIIRGTRHWLVLLTTPKEMVSANGEDFLKILAIHQVRLSNPFRASFGRNGRIFGNERRMANMVDHVSDFDSTGAWNDSELDVRFIAKEVCRGASKYITRFAHCPSRLQHTQTHEEQVSNPL